MFNRLPASLMIDTGEKIRPSAVATPGTARTFASVASLIAGALTGAVRPSARCGVTTTSLPSLAVWKTVAKAELIVSVRM